MSNRYNQEHDLTSVLLKKSTRQHLRDIGKKNDTYDKIINELIQLKEQHLN